MVSKGQFMGLNWNMCLLFHLYFLPTENPEDRYNLYMQYAESYPRAQAPKRVPLTFTKGIL